MISPWLSSELDRCLLQLASRPDELLEQSVDLSECYLDTTCVKANVHFPVDWVLLVKIGKMTRVKVVRKHPQLPLPKRQPGQPDLLLRGGS